MVPLLSYHQCCTPKYHENKSIGNIFVACPPHQYHKTCLQPLPLSAKRRERNQTVQSARASLYSSLQVESWLIRYHAEQAHHDDRSGKHARKPLWVQQRDHRHDLCAEADTGEMQKTEYGSVCSFRRPGQGLLYCQLLVLWTVENAGTPWLFP